MVERFPLERGVVDVVCYRVVAGEDNRHDILNDEIIQIDLNRPAQPRFVEVEQLVFSVIFYESIHYLSSCDRSALERSNLSEDLDLWGRLGAEWDRIKNHFFDMGLEVARDDAAGYAFVEQADETEEDQEEWETRMKHLCPRVLRRTRLSYHQTIFMVLLREELMRFEQEQEEGDHLYRSSQDLREIMLPYYPEMHDEKRFTVKYPV